MVTGVVRRAIGAVLLGGILSHTGVAQSPPAFEGAITMRLRATGAQGAGQELEYLIGPGRMRVNVPSPLGAMALIMRPAEQKAIVLLDAQQMYFEQPLPQPASSPPASTGAATAAVTRTGKTETIAGERCEQLLVQDANGTVDLCVARGLGAYADAMGGIRPRGSAPEWQRALAREGAFPLRVTGPDGTVLLEATKVERRKVSRALFEVPGSYSRMQRPPGR
jgi:hypothetical protein